MTIQDFLKLTYLTTKERYKLLIFDKKNISYDLFLSNVESFYIERPRIICLDGFSVSVQGGIYTLCSPRKHTKIYDSLEISKPSSKDKIFIDNEDIQSYVKLQDIQDMINRHNGINISKTFKNFSSINYYKYVNNIRKSKLNCILQKNK